MQVHDEMSQNGCCAGVRILPSRGQIPWAQGYYASNTPSWPASIIQSVVLLTAEIAVGLIEADSERHLSFRVPNAAIIAAEARNLCARIPAHYHRSALLCDAIATSCLGVWDGSMCAPPVAPCHI